VKQVEPERSSLAGLGRFAGAGIELAGLSAMFAFAGYGIDRWMGNDRLIATGILALIGFALALTRFIVIASKMNK